MSRWWKFNLVGAGGVVVQTAVLAGLEYCGIHYLAATLLAVESALLHNFLWHLKWTWADRHNSGLGRMLMRFHLLNGSLSIVGNVLMMRLLAGALELPLPLANLMSIGVCALGNFLLADRLVFWCYTFPPRSRRPF